MRAMTTTTQRLTADDVWNMPEVPGKRFELVRGELIEMPGSGGRHAHIALELTYFLRSLPGIRDLGFVFGDALSYILARDPDTIRIPDVSFIRYERLGTRVIPDSFLPVAPDLAVEIASSFDRPAKLYAKAREYFAAGTFIVWIFWPLTREIDIMTSDGVTRRLGPDDELVLPDFLPAARVQVSELFPNVPTETDTPTD